jgi:hypothetical protein
MQYVIATATAFLMEPNGAPLLVTAGERWDARSPVVKRHPGNFAPPAEDDIRGVVESASAAPGEKRVTRTK